MTCTPSKGRQISGESLGVSALLAAKDPSLASSGRQRSLWSESVDSHVESVCSLLSHLVCPVLSDLIIVFSVIVFFSIFNVKILFAQFYVFIHVFQALSHIIVS